MGKIANALQERINNNSLHNYYNAVATIVNYDPIQNTAAVTYTDPNGQIEYTHEKAHVCTPLGGLTTDILRPGDKCVVVFSENNVTAPIIIGSATNLYKEKRCSDEGASIVTVDVEEEPETIKPLYMQWFDFANTVIKKFVGLLFGDFSLFDAKRYTYKLIYESDKYYRTEQGITNLDTKSTIKIRANGDIDMFVEDNVGIRISKDDKKIYMYGDIIFNNRTCNFFSRYNHHLLGRHRCHICDIIDCDIINNGQVIENTSDNTSTNIPTTNEPIEKPPILTDTSSDNSGNAPIDVSQDTNKQDTWLYPVEKRFTTISTYYGYDDWRGGMHWGIDICGSGGNNINGTNIYASKSGTVKKIKTDYIPGYDYGMFIEVGHNNGFSTFYAHCSAVYVSKGQQVQQGDVIGAVGSTGWSTGPHLHFEVRTSEGKKVNPFDYISIPS